MDFKTKYLGKNFQHFKTIDSTQTYIKKLIHKKTAEIGTVVLADHQEIGKGTQGRIWFSLPKPQLMFSVLLKPSLAPQKLPMINILSGVLMATVFEEMGVYAKVKWPNDVYIDNKKVGGILSELVTEDGNTYIVLGVGMNVDASSTDFPKEIKTSATALSLYCTSVNRFEILEKFLVKLETALYLWTSEELIAFTQKEFERLWIYRNKVIHIEQQSKKLHGTSTGIDTFGALQLKTSSGIEKIISGSISVI